MATQAAPDVKMAKAPGKKTLRSLEAERSANGGFIVRHRFNNSGPTYTEPEEHTFGKGEGGKVLEHIGKNLGIGGDKESKE